MKPTVFLSAILLGLASAIPTTRAPHDGLRTIHQFPNHTWIENMAFRQNGQILGTDVVNSRIYLVDPLHPQSEPPIVAQFANSTCVAGIAEVEEDVFYTQTIIGDVYSFTFVPNSTAIWKVDMRHYAQSGKATVTKVIDIPQAGLLNGMTLLSQRDGTILMADSYEGVVWRLNVHTLAYEVVFDSAYLKPIPSDFPAFGVNGIGISDSTLYFSSSNQKILGKVPIAANGIPTGNPTIITNNVADADDFAIDSDGSVYLCQNAVNTLVRVSPDGQLQTIAGGPNSTELLGPVSARFGRGPTDRDVLYVSTDGLSFGTSPAPLTTAGKIAAIDIKRW